MVHDSARAAGHLERERLWPRVWQMACREAELAAPGDFVVYDILDDSILVVRTGPGADDLAAMYNVCQHRGRRLVDEPRGHVGKAFRCRFHGWQYDRSGGLTHVHFEEDWRGCAAFDTAQLGLPRVALARWGGWIWINQDPDAVPLADFLGEVPRFLDPFAPAAMRPLWWKTILAPANWKILVGAFIEAYHSGATHVSGINYRSARVPGLALGDHAMLYGEPGPFTEYKAEDGRWVTPTSLQENMWANFTHLGRTIGAMTLAPGMAAFARLRVLPDDTPVDVVMTKLFDFHREEMEARGIAWPETLTLEAWAAAGLDWHIFPNSIVLPTFDGALWYRMRPHGDDPDRSVVDIWSLGRFAAGREPVVQQELFHGFEALRGQCEFLEEDFANLEAVSRGMKSRGFRGGILNPVQEAAVVNFHAVLERYLSRA
ncbi:MAG: aromatic ring-hydroxylating dioxygenase subunit alpha [bacterium]|nr:aromatic ring-hydroxylating dioxygenase subunit alpha [bacterium]